VSLHNPVRPPPWLKLGPGARGVHASLHNPVRPPPWLKLGPGARGNQVSGLEHAVVSLRVSSKGSYFMVHCAAHANPQVGAPVAVCHAGLADAAGGSCCGVSAGRRRAPSGPSCAGGRTYHSLGLDPTFGCRDALGWCRCAAYRLCRDESICSTFRFARFAWVFMLVQACQGLPVCQVQTVSYVHIAHAFMLWLMCCYAS